MGLLRQWVERESPELSTRVLTHTISNVDSGQPPVILGFIPDLFVEDNLQGVTIIGEAKTSEDFKRPRTRHQLQAFASFLSYKKNGVLLLSLEFSEFQSGRAMIRSILRESGKLDTNYNVITPLDFVL